MLSEPKERISHLMYSNIWKARNFKHFFSFTYSLPSVIVSNGKKVLLDKVALPLGNVRWLTIISRTVNQFKAYMTYISPLGECTILMDWFWTCNLLQGTWASFFQQMIEVQVYLFYLWELWRLTYFMILHVKQQWKFKTF